MAVQFIPATKRRRMSKARAARIWLREQGRCYLCGRKLRIGVDKYQIEHPDALCLGGSDDDADLRVVCDECHKVKTKQDLADKARRDRIVTASWQREDARRTPKIRSAGFRKAAPQRTATTPPRKRLHHFEDTP